MARRDERHTLADEYRNHVNDELVDGPGIEKRCDDAAATHHPDVFAFLSAQTLHEIPERFFDELEAGGHLLLWPTRESVVSFDAVHLWRALPSFLKAQDKVMGLSSHK